ncbi:MAG: hypothetical protein QNJ22_05410 [Desulfosarcinaceae bacterium]|nr:hypothetical protein [Desulfosarcinaceae bacterium]
MHRTRNRFGCVFLIGFCLILLPWVVEAQELRRVEIPSTFNPVGSGARALAVGGAFIARADDATAASWNPGGLYQLKDHPEVSFVGALVNRTEDNRFATNPEADGRQRVSFPAVNYLSAVYPLPPILGGRRFVLSANYQRLYDMHRSWRFPLAQDESDLAVTQTIDYRQAGALTALGLSVGAQVAQSDKWGLVGVGATFNLWDAGFNENQWEQQTRQTGAGTLGANAFNFTVDSVDRFSLKGVNINLGLHWQHPRNQYALKHHFAFGLVYKSALMADIVHRSRFVSDLRFPDQPSADTVNSRVTKTDEQLEFPSTIGMGLAWEPQPRQTVITLDIYRTDWGDFVLEDENGNRTSPISGKPIGKAEIDPTYPVRLGFQHIFGYLDPDEYGYQVPLRLGALYDPSPAEGSPDEFYGGSIGSGVLVRQSDRHFALDIAYQLRFAREVGTSILQNLGFKQDVTEHTLYTSMIIRF